jgi:uncharacterized protein (TIGR03492 family)
LIAPTLSNMKLLCISNGHGEDAIALPVLQELRKLPNPPEIVTLPIVGVGKAYTNNGFAIAGTVQTMPSGGFNQDGRELVRDIRGGLIGLTISQYQTAKTWARSGGKILAVGDIVPLLLAWLSGADYAFIGTAKSEYYERDDRGDILPLRRDRWEVKTGSVYFPWERWLLSRSKCKAVFPRDRLTADILKQFQIPAFDLGNPMMDGMGIVDSLKPPAQDEFRITLLPGSRPPEAYANWQTILTALKSLLSVFPDRSIVGLAAIAPTLDLPTLEKQLTAQGWTKIIDLDPYLSTLTPDRRARYYRQENITIGIITNAYGYCMHFGECAIAMAGTATEQFIGLGKPAFTIPGAGPQFTPAFAEAQTRLLGASIILVPHPEDLGREIGQLFNHPEKLHAIEHNGYLRMGTPGAAQRIAQKIAHWQL